MVTAVIGVLPTDRDSGLGLLTLFLRELRKFENLQNRIVTEEEGDKTNRERKTETERVGVRTP